MAQSVSEIMARNVVTLSTNSSVQEAAARMRDDDIGNVIVLDESDQLQGIVTDRDITVRAVADGRNPSEVTVGEICSGDLVTASPNDDLAEVAERMRQANVRRIPVVEGGRPVGIVSLGDVAIETESDSGTTLADISSEPGNN
jgi:CBS domain-containing protein